MTLIDYESFRGLFAESSIEISPEIYAKFQAYADILAEKNAVMNLTAITEPFEVAEKHFLDSALPLYLADFAAGSSVVDVGAGAGFPSVPMAILRPDLRTTMIDSLQKRVKFLAETTEKLGISANCLHSRAEDAGRGELRESFDIAVARAVSRLSVLCEYCLPLVRVGGFFAAMKGADCAEELAEAKKAVRILGGRVADVREYRLPSGDGRSLIIIEKVVHTQAAYPRPYGKIKAKPL